jgi:hypothetical protein
MGASPNMRHKVLHKSAMSPFAFPPSDCSLSNPPYLLLFPRVLVLMVCARGSKEVVDEGLGSDRGGKRSLLPIPD